MGDLTDKSEAIDQETLKKLSETDGIPKFSHICRACLCETRESGQKLDSTLLLFNEPQEIRYLIEESTGVKILDLNFLPNNICDNCLKTLRAWYKFRSQTQCSNEILKKYLTNLSTTLDKKTFSSEDLDKDVCQIEGFHVKVVNDKHEVVGIVFDCDSCSMTFTNVLDLEKHKEEHITHNTKAFKCEHCAKSFIHRTSLNNHIELSHTLLKGHKFQCDVCGKRFKSPAEFRLHKSKKCISSALIEECKVRPVHVSLAEVIAAGEKALRETKISCILCKKNFKTQDAFVNHYPKHKNLTCSICHQKFRSAKILETHVRKHLRKKVCACPICSRSYYATRSMLRHIREHSTREWVYRCNVCQQEFFRVKEFEAHMLEHLAAKEDETNDKAEQDDDEAEYVNIKNEDSIDIESDTSDEDDLRNLSVKKIKKESPSSHETFQSIKVEDDSEEDSTHIANEDSTIKMDIDIDSKEGLQLIKTEEQEYYSESDIDTEYEDSNQATKDTSTKTDPEDNVKLENRDESFSEEEEDSADDVSDDQADDMEKLLKKCKLTCHVPGCEIKCSTFTNIWGHYVREHLTEERPYKCSVCSEEYDGKFALRSHVKKYYCFKCPVCKKTKTSCADLRQHVIRTHPNRTFKCVKCDKTFARASTLRYHNVTNHNNTKEFTCPVCSKIFFVEQRFILHCTIHEDIKELQCSICNKQFLTKFRLKRHYDKVCSKKKSN